MSAGMAPEAQADLLLHGTLFADEVDGAEPAAASSLRQQMRAELIAKLEKGKPLLVYLGVDPTATDLHIGHFVPTLKLRQLQLLGHRIVFLLGDYTARIGDPTGRSKERPALTPDELDRMADGYAEQAFRVLDRDSTVIRRNSEWLSQLDFAKIIELASIFPLKQIIARREFQERLEAGKTLRFHETLYALMQGYDAYALGCDVQVGGYDQYFNLLAGRTIQQHYGQEPHVMLTLPLLVGTDGRKMSKSYGNAITLGDSARDMYGKVMRVADAWIENYLDLACMLMDRAENAVLREAFNRGSMNPLEVKEGIARHIVSLYHDDAIAAAEQEWFRQHIRGKKLPDEIPEQAVPSTLAAGADWPTILVELGLMKSKGEVRRLIKGGGLRIEGEKVQDPATVWDGQDGTLVQYGKRKRVRLRCDS